MSNMTDVALRDFLYMATRLAKAAARYVENRI